MLPHKPITNIACKMSTYSVPAENDRTMTMDLISGNKLVHFTEYQGQETISISYWRFKVDQKTKLSAFKFGIFKFSKLNR